MEYSTKPLDASTWRDFKRLVEANNGVWGGCWCMWYHGEQAASDDTPAARRKAKEGRVRQGQTHASLVYSDNTCVGWCQFGSPDELPRIHNQRAYLAANPILPDWRITCLFTGKGHRGKGVSYAALAGAIGEIRKLGGGVVEGYPDETEGRKVSPAFLFNGGLAVFEQLGFERTRRIGKHKWVVTLTV